MKSLIEYITESSKNNGEKLAKAFIDHISKFEFKKGLVGGKFAKMPAIKQTSKASEIHSKIWEVVKKNSRGCNTTANDVSQMVLDKENVTVLELDGNGDVTVCNPSLDEGFTLIAQAEYDKDDEKSYVVWTKVDATTLKNHADHSNRHNKFYKMGGEFYTEIKTTFTLK